MKNVNRSVAMVLRYWIPTRLTYKLVDVQGFDGKHHIWAWLWWNFVR